MVQRGEFDRGAVFQTPKGTDMVVVASPGFIDGVRFSPMRNNSIDRHSSRNLPLKLSSSPFCHILPGSMWGVDVLRGKPFEDGLAYEFGAIVVPQVRRCTSDTDQLGQYFNDTLGADRAGHINRQALSDGRRRRTWLCASNSSMSAFRAETLCRDSLAIHLVAPERARGF